MRPEVQITCLVIFVTACTLGYVLIINKGQLFNENRENLSEDSYIVSKINQILITIKEITNQSQQKPQTPEDSPNIYKGKYLQFFTCKTDHCFLLVGIYNGTKEHYRKSETLL